MLSKGTSSLITKSPIMLEESTFKANKGSFIMRGKYIFILLTATVFPVGKERFAASMSKLTVEVKLFFVQSTVLDDVTD